MHTVVQHDLDIAQTLTAVREAERLKDEEERMIKAVTDIGSSVKIDLDGEEVVESDESKKDAISGKLRHISRFQYCTFRSQKF